MKRSVLALALLLVLSPDAHAATTAWGYSGLVTMPDADTAGRRELTVGARAILPHASPDLSGLSLLGFARYGIFDGLEASIAYGLPGLAYPTASLKMQLMRATAQNPTSIALGATLLGAVAAGPVAGSGYFLAVSRDLVGRVGAREANWGRLHLGFQGDLALNARLMLGVELPLGQSGRLMLEALGPQSGAGAHGALGVELAPAPWVRLSAATLGVPDQPFWQPGAMVGAQVQALLPEAKPQALPEREGEPTSAAPTLSTPAPSMPGASLTPPALPASTLVGRVIGADGAPKAGYTVRVTGSPNRATTTATGYFFLPRLTPGQTSLEVLDPAGSVVATASTTVRSGTPTSLTLQVRPSERTAQVQRRGWIEGTVIDAATQAPIGGARIVLEGSGVSVMAIASSEGKFRIIDLVPGDYRVRAERRGFRTGTYQARLMEPELVTRVQLTLEKGR